MHRGIAILFCYSILTSKLGMANCNTLGFERAQIMLIGLSHLEASVYTPIAMTLTQRLGNVGPIANLLRQLAEDFIQTKASLKAQLQASVTCPDAGREDFSQQCHTITEQDCESWQVLLDQLCDTAAIFEDLNNSLASKYRYRPRVVKSFLRWLRTIRSYGK